MCPTIIKMVTHYLSTGYNGVQKKAQVGKVKRLIYVAQAKAENYISLKTLITGTLFCTTLLTVLYIFKVFAWGS